MATREAACLCGQLRLDGVGRPVRRLDLQLPVLPAQDRQRLRHAGGVQGRPGAGRGPLQRLHAASPTRRTGRSTSFTSAPSAARRCSTRSRPSRTWSSSRSARSRIRPFRRRPSRATTHGGIRGSVCPTRSYATTRGAVGRRCSRSTRPASSPRQLTVAASCSRRIPIPELLLQRRLLREPRGRTADAIEHLRRAIELWEGCSRLAQQDSDFDPAARRPAFKSWWAPLTPVVTDDRPVRRTER